MLQKVHYEKYFLSGPLRGLKVPCTIVAENPATFIFTGRKGKDVITGNRWEITRVWTGGAAPCGA